MPANHVPANRSRTARHRPLHLRRVVAGLVATALAVLLVPLPAMAVNSAVEDLEADLCPNGAAAAGPVQLTAAVVGLPSKTLTVSCDATLDLNGHALTMTGSIIITPGSTFTITDTSDDGDGVLTAEAPATFAAIQTTDATLVIAAGTVNATGGDRAAGIGGPNDSSVGPEGRAGGTVTITGGSVVAVGGRGGAGIGAGNGGSDGGVVTISGGTVEATGGVTGSSGGPYGGAGIGGGDARGLPLTEGTGAVVQITGGTVTATGGSGAAGIGGGEGGGNGGDVTITGGTVSANGGVNGGAGIGGGRNLPNDPTHDGGGGGSVTILGGTVTATGGAPGNLSDGGAGIGGGSAYAGTAPYRYPAGSGATVLIEGGIVTATAGSTQAATIGAGGDLGDPILTGAAGTLTLGAFAVRTDDLPTPTTPRTIITFGGPAATPSTPSTPVLTGGALPVLPAGVAAWNRVDGTRPPLPATASGARAVTYGTAPASVTVTGAPGTTAARGIVADPNGELGAEVCVALPVGSVIEVWVLSTPRLVAAHRVTDAPCQRFAVPFVAPLGAGGPIGAGTHTLQFALATAGGMESFDIGITVGGPVPNVVPAGEGGAQGSLTLALAVLLAVALVALLAGMPAGSGARPIAGRGRSI